MPGEPLTARRIKELMAEWQMLRFGLSEEDAAEAWAESMALHEEQDRAAALSPVAPPDLDVDSWADTMMDALRNSDDGNNPFYSDDEDTISLARQLAEAVVARRLRADKGTEGSAE